MARSERGRRHNDADSSDDNTRGRSARDRGRNVSQDSRDSEVKTKYKCFELTRKPTAPGRRVTWRNVNVRQMSLKGAKLQKTANDGRRGAEKNLEHDAFVEMQFDQLNEAQLSAVLEAVRGVQDAERNINAKWSPVHIECLRSKQGGLFRNAGGETTRIRVIVKRHDRSLTITGRPLRSRAPRHFTQQINVDRSRENNRPTGESQRSRNQRDRSTQSQSRRQERNPRSPDREARSRKAQDKFDSDPLRGLFEDKTQSTPVVHHPAEPQPPHQEPRYPQQDPYWGQEQQQWQQQRQADHHHHHHRPNVHYGNQQPVQWHVPQHHYPHQGQQQYPDSSNIPTRAELNELEGKYRDLQQDLRDQRTHINDLDNDVAAQLNNMAIDDDYNSPRSHAVNSDFDERDPVYTPATGSYIDSPPQFPVGGQRKNSDAGRYHDGQEQYLRGFGDGERFMVPNDLPRRHGGGGGGRLLHRHRGPPVLHHQGDDPLNDQGYDDYPREPASPRLQRRDNVDYGTAGRQRYAPHHHA